MAEYTNLVRPDYMKERFCEGCGRLQLQSNGRVYMKCKRCTQWNLFEAVEDKEYPQTARHNSDEKKDNSLAVFLEVERAVTGQNQRRNRR